MASVSQQDIADYSKYLVSQGHKPEDVKDYADYLASTHDVKPEPMSALKAFIIKGEEGLMSGLRPVVAGIGAAAGNINAQMQSGKSLGSLMPRNTMRQEFDNAGAPTVNLKQSGDAFVQGRQEANQEQQKAHDDHPYISGAANIAGSIATIPFLPVAPTLKGALGLGAGLGAANAAGSADSLKGAAIDVVGGAGLGAAGYGVAKGIGKAADVVTNSEFGQVAGQKIKDIAKKIGVGTPSELTGVPDKEIEAYALRADKVKDIINKNMSEGKFDSQLAANHMRENVMNDVTRTRRALGSQIQDALNSAPKDPVFSTMRHFLHISELAYPLRGTRNRTGPVFNALRIGAKMRFGNNSPLACSKLLTLRRLLLPKKFISPRSIISPVSRAGE